MSETSMTILGLLLLIYLFISMIGSICWIWFGTNSYMLDSFIDSYKERILDKNIFGKFYVTIFMILSIPSYLIAAIFLYGYLFVNWLYRLGIKKEKENNV